MKTVKYILLGLIAVGFSISMDSAIKKPFSAELSGCVFSYTDPLNGSYTANIGGGTGEMAGLTTARGTFKSIDNGDGTVYVLTSSNSTGGGNRFTIRSNHIVDLAGGTITDSADSPTTYTSVSLRVASGKNKGRYSSKSASSSGTTSGSDFSLTKMSISGSF